MSHEYRLSVHTPQETRSIVLQPQDYERDLSEVLRRAGLPLNTRCGRRRLCNGCMVEATVGELKGESGTSQSAGPLRACECFLIPGKDVEIHVPARSLLAHAPQIVATFRCNVSHALDPLWQRIRWPDEAGPVDRTNVEATCAEFAALFARELPVVAHDALLGLPPNERRNASLVCEYRGDDWLISHRSLERRPEFGIAIDIGTTTVVAMLVDLDSGEVGASASALNAQIALGDNVVTRINLCTQNKACIAELQDAVLQTIERLVEQLSSQAGVVRDQLVTLAVAGNTTMLHLLAGVDPSSLGVAPFTPQFLEYRRMPLQGLRSHESGTNDPGASQRTVATRFTTDAAAHLLPSAGAYVGADITAGVFASGMIYRQEPCLLVDIGTNGEIVLNYEGRLIGCATAAGPAFEGAGMSCGVRAGTGAISHVQLEGSPPVARVEVIGDASPIGFCGTGYVDAVAQTRRHDLIGRTGRITPRGQACPLFHQLPKGRGFQFGQARGDQPLVVSEADIASLLQAKAAIAAGILCLLARFQLRSADIATVYLAGGFGFHMDLDSLIGCGILPGFERGQIEVVGNSALAGAYLAMLDAGALKEMRRLAREMEIVELNLEANFTSCYIDQLFLP